MIYTCTLNPSLDYFLEFDQEIVVGETNRSNLEYYEAGGKGVNVSIVLSNMQIPSKALGFIGGFTKDFYIELLQKYEFLRPSFTYIEGNTRINIKLKGQVETDMNALGPAINHEHMELLQKKVERLDEDDIFVFSGNCPENVLEDVLQMIHTVAQNGVRLVLDTNPAIIEKCLDCGPYLIKPNHEEAEALAGHPLKTEEDFIALGKECVQKGAKNVIISLDAEGSLMVNGDGVWRCEKDQHAQVVNTVGAGDSMVAGFVMNSLRSTDVVDSYRYANCCGVATAFSKGLATRDKINELYTSLKIDKIQ